MNISIKHTEPKELTAAENEVITIKYNKKDDFFPDNYYKYNLNSVLQTDFLQIKKIPNYLFMRAVSGLLLASLIK